MCKHFLVVWGLLNFAYRIDYYITYLIGRDGLVALC